MGKYLNRDISWLAFNHRVLDETKKEIPIGEKILFHGISFSNFKEFSQVRYPIMLEDPLVKNSEKEDVVKAITTHYVLLHSAFNKFNKKHGIITSLTELGKDEIKYLNDYFKRNIFPALQPITVERSEKINLHSGIYVIMEVIGTDDVIRYGYIEIPESVSRFLPIPKKHTAVLLEEVILYNLPSLFRNRNLQKITVININRSAQVYQQSTNITDPYDLIKKTLKERESTWITTVEILSAEKKSVLKFIKKILPLTKNTIVFFTNHLAMNMLKDFPYDDVLPKDELIRKFHPIDTFPDRDILGYIRKKDRLVFHPYESYQNSFVKFIQESSVDPDVISIKISLYRVSNNSQIIDALLKAADSGKIVIVLVELKARFDEHHNMEISNILREGGVRIVYTKPNIKTHSKVCLVTRREKKKIRIYSHVGTGNYSESNAKQYTDYSYFSANQTLGIDLTKFFNLLTSDQDAFKSKKIIYAPYNMRDEISQNIEEQVKLAKEKKPARIIIKCNALTDDKIADKLTDAANEGVDIIMIIRSACIIQPQKNIKIYSVVGRFLEHSRVYIFGMGKKSKMYIGSADIMHRNLSLRNELLLLVESDDIKSRIHKHIQMYLNDTVNRREILPDYQYKDLSPKKDKKAFNCQEGFIKEAKKLE